MNLLKLFGIMIVSLFFEMVCVNFSYSATDVAAYCTGTPPLVGLNIPGKLKDKLNSYPSKVTPTEDGLYILCFGDVVPISISEPLVLVGQQAKSLIIYGLNISTTNDKTLLTVSGVNTTILNSTFTGSGSGTAIQVNGAAAIESTTLTNFTTGINVAKDASVRLAKNIFTIADAANAVVFDASVASPIDSTLVGKKVSEADPTKAESITGKLNLNSCAGSVEMYYKLDIKESPLQYHPTAPCQVAASDKDIELEFADGIKESIANGSCAFKCDNFSEGLSTHVTFTYTSADGKSYPFIPLPTKKFSELPKYFVPLPTGQTIGTSGADGTTTIDTGGGQIIETGGGTSGTENTGGGEISTEGGTTSTGGQTTSTGGGSTSGTGNTQTGGGDALLVDGANNESDDPDNTDSQAKAQATDAVGQGSGACGANISTSAPTSASALIQLLLIFGALPIIRFSRQD